MRAARPGGLNRGSHFCKFSALRREPPRLPLRRELSNCIKDLSSTTEGEITRGHCMHRGVDEHRVKKRSFILLLLISSAFAHTHCISLSHAVKSFGRDSSHCKQGEPRSAVQGAHLSRRLSRSWHCGGRFRRFARHSKPEYAARFRGKQKNAAKKPSPPRRRGLLVCNKIICNRGIRRCGGLKRFSTSRGKIPRHSPRFEKRNGRKSFRSREQRPGEAFRP